MATAHQKVTRALLACGAVAGPLFIVVVLAQDLTRAGFDPGGHPLSLLSQGDLGWIQITNFVVTGLLTLAFAAGLSRLPPPEHLGRTVPMLIAGYGLGLVTVGVFVTDPASGYPPGAPEPEETTLPGAVHNGGAMVVFACLIAACWVVARGFAARGARAWALASAVMGLTVLVLLVLGAANADQQSLLSRAAAFLGWGWVSVSAARQLRTLNSNRKDADVAR
jgi:lysylphosphatidylglycerol synthetase-like protein (DUF2156 family)